jgi:spoIIIJ-associated protein
VKQSEVKKAEKTVKDFLARLGVSATAKVFAVEEYLKIEIDGPDSSLLIGYHGDNLKALRHLLSCVLRREVSDQVVVSVDVAGYLEKREEQIRGMAKKAMSKAKRSGRPEPLPPMNAFERRIAHSFITEEGYLSQSEGEGRERHIVVKAK